MASALSAGALLPENPPPDLSERSLVDVVKFAIAGACARPTDRGIIKFVNDSKPEASRKDIVTLLSRKGYFGSWWDRTLVEGSDGLPPERWYFMIQPFELPESLAGSPPSSSPVSSEVEAALAEGPPHSPAAFSSSLVAPPAHARELWPQSTPRARTAGVAHPDGSVVYAGPRVSEVGLVDVCIICGDTTHQRDAARIVLCDCEICSTEVHLDCLALSSVPDYQWFCSAACRASTVRMLEGATSSPSSSSSLSGDAAAPPLVVTPSGFGLFRVFRPPLSRLQPADASIESAELVRASDVAAARAWQVAFEKDERDKAIAVAEQDVALCGYRGCGVFDAENATQPEVSRPWTGIVYCLQGTLTIALLPQKREISASGGDPVVGGALEQAPAQNDAERKAGVVAAPPSATAARLPHSPGTPGGPTCSGGGAPPETGGFLRREPDHGDSGGSSTEDEVPHVRRKEVAAPIEGGAATPARGLEVVLEDPRPVEEVDPVDHQDLYTPDQQGLRVSSRLRDSAWAPSERLLMSNVYTTSALQRSDVAEDHHSGDTGRGQVSGGDGEEGDHHTRKSRRRRSRPQGASTTLAAGSRGPQDTGASALGRGSGSVRRRSTALSDAAADDAAIYNTFDSWAVKLSRKHHGVAASHPRGGPLVVLENPRGPTSFTLHPGEKAVIPANKPHTVVFGDGCAHAYAVDTSENFEFEANMWPILAAWDRDRRTAGQAQPLLRLYKERLSHLDEARRLADEKEKRIRQLESELETLREKMRSRFDAVQSLVSAMAEDVPPLL